VHPIGSESPRRAAPRTSTASARRPQADSPAQRQRRPLKTSALRRPPDGARPLVGVARRAVDKSGRAVRRASRRADPGPPVRRELRLRHLPRRQADRGRRRHRRGSRRQRVRRGLRRNRRTSRSSGRCSRGSTTARARHPAAVNACKAANRRRSRLPRSHPTDNLRRLHRPARSCAHGSARPEPASTLSGRRRLTCGAPSLAASGRDRRRAEDAAR